MEPHILFDEGSQRSFLTKGLADRLQVQPHDTVELSLSTLSAGSSCTSKFDVATINLHGVSGQLITLTVIIISTIITPIHTADQKSNSQSSLPQWTVFSSSNFFSRTIFITMLIGADQYWNM